MKNHMKNHIFAMFVESLLIQERFLQDMKKYMKNLTLAISVESLLVD